MLKYKIDYFGFVYIWRDKKRKMCYIGSHFGSLDDKYLGSNTRFLRAIKKRPQDFRRKILFLLKQCDRQILLQEEERWLKMISPVDLQNKYYNIKRRGTGGFVTEGYTFDQRQKYNEKLRNRPAKGAKHYKSKQCICAGHLFTTLAEAKKLLGFSPSKRIHSRLYKDYYFVIDGPPSDEEITKNQLKRDENKLICIKAMQNFNKNAPQDYHQKRTQKSHQKRKELKGAKIIINDKEFNSIRDASEILNLKSHQIRKRLQNDNWPTWYYVTDSSNSIESTNSKE